MTENALPGLLKTNYFNNKFGTEDGAKPTRMYLLRPELAQIYNLRRQEEAKAKAIQEYKEKKKKKEEAEKDQKKSESDAHKICLESKFENERKITKNLSKGVLPKNLKRGPYAVVDE